MLRFSDILKSKCSQKKTFQVGPLTFEELSRATLCIVKYVQSKLFKEPLKVLHNHPDFDEPVISATHTQFKQNPSLHSIQDIDPYVVDGVLRVGGRLQNSPLPLHSRHPILLPNHHATDLIILMIHFKEGHLGSTQVLNTLRRDYWIEKGKSTVKKALSKCLVCRFWKAKPGVQKMANLPAHRVTPNPPFTACGTDLMGPITIKIGRSDVKRYVCIFNCLATRAVHFEVVESLDTTAFIQAFRRFCNRRTSRPKHMYSDNGGNFIAANCELNDGLKALKSQKFNDALATEQIIWHFNPPLASHQGGFYETFFRLVRKIIQCTVDEATLREYELLTLMTEIERILNDRPITSLPDSPHEMAALTPSMILTGSLGSSSPLNVPLKADAYRHSWRKTQYLADLFWQRWLREYLPLLQKRPKWFGTSPNLQPGDLVLVKDENAKRSLWPKAVVIEVMPDSTGLVRRARVKTKDCILQRDIRKLCVLESV